MDATELISSECATLQPVHGGPPSDESGGRNEAQRRSGETTMIELLHMIFWGLVGSALTAMVIFIVVKIWRDYGSR
jgi:hypothetical protein